MSTATPTAIDPAGLFVSPAFAQGMLAPAGAQLLFVGGQNGVDATGALVPGGLGPQTAQALRNVLAVLEAAGTGPEHVLKLNIHLAAGENPDAGFAASREVWTTRTAVTVLGFPPIRPGVLVEVDAVAVVPK